MTFHEAEHARQQYIADQNMAEQTAYSVFGEPGITVFLVELGTKGNFSKKLRNALETKAQGPWSGIVAVVKRSDHVSLETAISGETEYQVIPLATRRVSSNRAVDTFAIDAEGIAELDNASGENVMYVVVSSVTGIAPDNWNGVSDCVDIPLPEETSPFYLGEVATSVVRASRPEAEIYQVPVDIKDLNISGIKDLLARLVSDFSYVYFACAEEAAGGVIRVDSYMLVSRELGIERVYNALIHMAKQKAENAVHTVLVIGQDRP